MIKNKSGIWGEVLTARYLRDRGFQILSSNYSCRLGELDLVAMIDETMCFVEVKTRGENPLMAPSEAVDSFKQERMIKTSSIYLKASGWKGKTRFDVSEVFLDDNFKLVKLNYIENAFGAEG